MKLPKWKQVRSFVQDFRRDVIRMMRLRFVLTAMAILIVVFLIMLTSINIIMKTVSQSQSMHLLEQIAASERYNSLVTQPPDGGMPPPALPPEATAPETTAPESSDAAAAQADPGDGGIVSLAWGSWDAESQPEAQTPQDGGEWSWNWGWGGWKADPQPEVQSPQEGGGWGWGGQERQEPPQRQEDSAQEGRRPPQEWQEQRPSENIPPPWAPQEPDDSDDDDSDDDDEPETRRIQPAQTEPPAPEVQQNMTDPPAVQTEPPQAPRDPETQTRTETVPETTEPLPTEPPPSETHIPEPREPRPDRWNVSITIDHFAVMADPEGNFLGLRNTEDYTDAEAAEILAGILETGKDKGMYGWLQFCRAEKDYGTLLVITDKTSDQGLLNNLFRLTVWVGLAMLLLLLVILIFLSRMITDPVQSAFTRQKQFVSDAGHELKTPIAVLTANADILQDEIGENKWLGYMQEQIGRMNQLVGDLLRLARMDNATQEYHFEDFDLSMAVAATTLPFESAAFEQNRNLEMDVQPNVTYHGSEQHIRQLCAIFIDNALKYSNENGIIKVTLLQRGEHCILEFYNTGCEISPAETERIFERFYRGDKARNNKGKSGYGLGLAIAKSIMDVHRIRIQVTCEQGRWIRFLLTM